MKTKIATIVTAVAAGVFSYNTSFGWGHQGHQMVGEVAMHYMSKPVQDSVKKYLGDMTIEKAATWMDDMRSNPKYKYMASWHFINIDKGKNYVANKDTNIITEINIAFDKLKHRNKLSNDEVKMNIMILIHLLGDLHQPLHVGYGNDRGGNQLTVTFAGEPYNLHSVWDEGIIEQQNITLKTVLAQYKSYTKQQIAEVKKVDDVAWLNQSRAYLPQIYSFKNNTIDDKYIQLNKSVIEKQILCGGLRLEEMLEEVFKAEK